MTRSLDPDDLRIHRYPEPVLRKMAEPVLEITDEIRAMAEGMIRTMNTHHGLGLAANQVGWLKRLAIVSDTGEPGDEWVVINPEILENDGSVAFEEGCLSFPGLLGVITRPERIRVRYRDLDGETVEEDLDGLKARCFLHEVDHLDGIVFITRMTPADRIRLKRPLRELEREFEEGRKVRR